MFYDDLNSWTRTTDEHGNQRCSINDRLGRLVSVVEKASADCQSGIVTNYYYDEVGSLVKVTNSKAQSTLHTYDNLGRLTRTTYADGFSESYEYDQNSNLRKKIDRQSKTTLYDYDSLDRLKTVTYCGTPITSSSYTYDKNSNLLQSQNENATITYTYDAGNRPLSEKYEVNPATRQVVDLGCPGTGGGGGGGGSIAAGSLVTLADGTKIPVQNLSVGDQVLSYDLELKQTVASTVVQLTTVQVNNLVVFRMKDGTTIRTDNNPYQKFYVMKPDGRVDMFGVPFIEVGDCMFNIAHGSWVRIVDKQYIEGGRYTMFDIVTNAPYNYVVNDYLDPCPKACPLGPTTESSASTSSTSGGVSQTYTVSYAYKGELLDRITYPDGLVVRHAYDGLGRIRTVFNGTTYASFNYYKDNQVKDIAFGNGLVGNYTYDPVGRPQSIVLKNGGTTLLSLTYAYNRTGTVSSVTGQSMSSAGGVLPVDERYRYDALQRLTNATVRLGSTTTTFWYEYDSLGNRLRQSLDGQITTYTYNSLNNQLSGWSRAGTSASFLYDSNGNLASRTITSGTSTIWGYTWNVPGRLLKVASGATQTSYAYDGLGRLLESVESVGGSTTTRFYAYVGTETLYEKEGSTSTDYIYAGGLRIAKATGLSTIKYYHTDHLGSTRLLTSSTKSIIFSDGYQPFGPDNGTPTGSEAERHKFTGKPYSSSIGLYYYYQRWYDPEIGRFVSEDPLGGELLDPQTLNAYVYVSNRPTVLTDPAGLAYFAVSGRNQACAEPSFQSVEAYFGSWFHNLVRPADCWGPAIGPMGLVGATTQVTGSIITRVGPVATKELIARAAIVITGLATLFGVMPTPTGPGLGGKFGYTTDLITAGSGGGLTNSGSGVSTSGLSGLGSTRSALGGLAGQGGGLTTAMADSMTISFGLRYWVRSLRAVPWIAKTCTYAVLGSVLFTIAHDVHLARAGQALSDAWVNAQITGILCGVGLGALRAARHA